MNKKGVDKNPHLFYLMNLNRNYASAGTSSAGASPSASSAGAAAAAAAFFSATFFATLDTHAFGLCSTAKRSCIIKK